ncbi:MAG: hypothetical protein WA667_16590 [Candidatus Nitrosopolaris sp.]
MKISQDLRAAVLEDWLNGKPRDIISRDNSLSTGSVSSIVSEWRNALTYPIADALRELGIMLRKSRITASQCASGFRLASIMKEMDVDEDNFGLFISEVYNKCKNIGLQPEYITSNTKQLLDLAGSIPLSQIPDYIQEKTSEKRKLDENIEKLGLEELDAKATLQQTLNEKKVSLAELEQFSALKVELSKLGISVEDVQHTIKTINGARQLGYNVDKIVMMVSNWDTFGALQSELQKGINALTVDKRNLQEEYDHLWELVSTHQQKLSLCEQLQDMGFGLKQLKLLFGTITEVAAANNIAPDMAVRKFLEDIEKNYDNKLGYDSKLADLKSQIDKTNNELIIVQKNLASKNQVARSLGELILMGFDDQQILNLAWALQSNTSNKESLEADLKKYGSLKKSIEELNQELRILESQNKPMETSDPLNIPKGELELREMQEFALLAPLVKAARGDMVEVNSLKRAIISTMDLAIRKIGSDASYAFKQTIHMINASDNSTTIPTMIDKDDRPSKDAYAIS